MLKLGISSAGLLLYSQDSRTQQCRNSHHTFHRVLDPPSQVLLGVGFARLLFSQTNPCVLYCSTGQSQCGLVSLGLMMSWGSAAGGSLLAGFW